MKKVAFICTHNSCRSQIAEAFGRHLAGDFFESFSAGTAVKDRINPDAVRIMKAHYGIDMEAEGQKPKMLSELPTIDAVVTMGCGVQCPYLPCTMREDWGLEDPTGKDEAAFLEVMESIRRKIPGLKKRLSMTLHTEKLILRPVEMSDADVFYRELGCNPAMTRFTGWNPYFSLESTRGKLAEDIRGNERRGSYSWAIVRADCRIDQKRTGQTQYGNPNMLVGSIGAYDYKPDKESIELGYSIFQKDWGCGYASEAAEAVVRFLLDTEGMKYVHAWTHAGNIASQKVLEKAGMKKQSVESGALQIDGKAADQVTFGITSQSATSQSARHSGMLQC